MIISNKLVVLAMREQTAREVGTRIKNNFDIDNKHLKTKLNQIISVSFILLFL